MAERVHGSADLSASPQGGLKVYMPTCASGPHLLNQKVRTHTSTVIASTNMPGHLANPSSSMIYRITSSQTSGTFTLTLTLPDTSTLTTGAILYNTTVAALQTILDSTFTAGNTSASGTPLPSGYIDIKFIGSFLYTNPGVLTVTPSAGLVTASLIQPGFTGTVDAFSPKGRDDKFYFDKIESEAPVEAYLHDPSQLTRTGTIAIPESMYANIKSSGETLGGEVEERTRKFWQGTKSKTFGKKMPSAFFS